MNSHQNNLKSLEKYKIFYRMEGKFSTISHVEDVANVEVVLSRFRYCVQLVFVRAKFLFEAINEQIDNKNAYSAYVLLKGYWETVAVMGYLIIKAEECISEGDYRELFYISKKINLGGKKYPNIDMVQAKGSSPTEFNQPKISKMMEIMDEHFNINVFKKEKNVKGFKSEYNEIIAEAGHPTFLGLVFATKKLKNGSFFPDNRKSWIRGEEKLLINYLDLASAYFFYYWNRFKKI